MKATLEFNLDDNDDRMAHLRCVKATDMALALWEITHNTKKGLLYYIEGLEIRGKQNDIDKLNPYETVETVFKEIYRILEERGINTDELIN